MSVGKFSPKRRKDNRAGSMQMMTNVNTGRRNKAMRRLQRNKLKRRGSGRGEEDPGTSP